MYEDRIGSQSDEARAVDAPARAEWAPPQLERLDLDESRQTKISKGGTEHTVYYS